VTNLEVIEVSLKLLGVIGQSETASDEQGAGALVALNQMLERWAAVDGIELGYFAQTSTADDCPIPAWAEQGVQSKLAQRLTADYPSNSAPAWVANDEENGYSSILRKSTHENMKPQDMRHMPSGSGHLSGDDYNIATGSFV
jgi:hypothetical protein